MDNARIKMIDSRKNTPFKISLVNIQTWNYIHKTNKNSNLLIIYIYNKSYFLKHLKVNLNRII